ncbi:PAN domain protein, partial [Necator americanus]
CLIKFQARPFSERPPEFTAPFEIELPVDSVELCATRCYQDGCSGAKYDPKAGTCALSYNDKRFCAKEDVVLHYKAEEVTWLHCVNCYSVKISSDVPSTTTSTETSVTTTPSRSTSFGTDVAAVEHKTTTSVSNGEEGFSTIPNSVPTSAPSKDFQRGEMIYHHIDQVFLYRVSAKPCELGRCLIKFQALPIAERPAHLTAPFELDLNVDSIELCATRCYQDGCTGAKYDPDSKTCSLSYNDKQYCTNAKVNLHYDAKNITWLHCVNCCMLRLITLMLRIIYIECTIIADSLKESDKTELAEQHEAAVTHVPSDDSTSLTTTTAQSTTKTVELSLATDGTTPDIGEPVQVQGCAIKFQARPFSQRPAQFHAEFEIELHVDSVELCATRCYQDGCSGAKFDPKTMSCALSYNDKHFCTTAEVVLHYEAKELTWIHCVNCYGLKSRTEQESKAEKKPENIDLTTTEPSSSTEAQRDKDSSTPALLNETTISQKEIDALLGKGDGCVVNFQIVELEERPPHFTSTFERSFTAETAEICAFRCYQDGCTGAKFQPDSNSCSLSYHDKAFCSNSNLVTVARPHQPVFMHCLSCVPHKSATEEGRTDNGFLSENVDEKTKKEDFEEAKLQVTSEPASSTMTTSPEGTVTEPGGREVLTTGKPEEFTTSSQKETSGEEPQKGNKVPNEQASVDEGASTVPAAGPSETPTTTTSSGEPSATSSTVTSPIGSEGTTSSASEPSQTPPTATSLIGSEETTASTSRHGSFVTEVDGDEVTTVGKPEQATTSSGVEASGEEPMESNKIPNVQASVDEGATTELGADSSETPTTAASNDEPSATSSSSTSPTGPKGTTSSAPGDSEPSETPPTAPSSIGNEGTTTNTSQHGSFVTEVDGRKPHEATTSSEIDSSGEEPIKGNKVPNVQTSVNEEATTEPTAGSSPTTETITSTAGPYGSSTRIGGADSTSPSSFARPLGIILHNLICSYFQGLVNLFSDSSSIQDTTPKTTTDEEDSIINPTLLERPHKISLPINVGFVPGSDPDIAHESGEDDEEEAGKTDSPKQLDYEDEVTVKTVELASATTTAAGGRSSTTEPPVQAVKDLIEALASGGLDAVLGQPRHQSEVLENASRKLGELKKYLHKPVERKQDCSSRHVRFVPGELTDLTTKFDADATVYSLQHCARICYEIGCTFAAFTRYPRPVCLMRYGNATASECDANVRSTTFWRFSGIQQVVKLECIKCDLKSEFISQKEKIDITNLNGFSTDDLNTVVPAHEGVTTRCDGRLEFQTLPVGSLPPLNITNDVGARTPADCAKKCFETGGCSTAGFLASPSGNISNGVCLLTSDANVCGNSADYVPQHAALNPFVISCIKCSPCTYNIRTVTPDRVLPDFSYVTSVSSVGECAQACYDRRCTMAQYNSQQHSCTMTSEPMESKCSREVAVVTEGVLPVTLECVSCSS